MAIQVLSPHLVNKIAAGEVIERPASIVKELVENSIDAGSSRIDVQIEDGGKKLIRISDNGCGMDKQDLALAFVPHATSKLKSEDDLFSIGTMGFRGEAMASIASIAHAHIRSAPKENPSQSGYEIEASGETISPTRPAACAGGTTATIRDLFFNTPARRKFLKSPNTESAHITEQITRLSLPHPDIAFTLAHNSRTVYNLPACSSTRQRISDIFGPQLAQSLLTIETRNSQVKISGLIGPPSAARSSGKWQYFFLNGRYIRDRLLAHALKEAYRGIVDPRKFPVAFIFIEIDPQEVDVNVHPTKIEVRFRDSQIVHSQLLAALRETINKSNLAPTAQLDTPDIISDLEAQPQDGEARKQDIRQAMADFFKSVPPVQPKLEYRETYRPKSPDVYIPHEHSKHNTVLPMAHRAPADTAIVQQEQNEHPQPRKAIENLPAIFQVADSYIVAATGDGVIIVDQHALHERILYNEFKARITAEKLPAQRMLIPATIKITPAEIDLIESNSLLFERLNIELEPFGPDTMAVQQFPTLLTSRNVDPVEFLREVLDLLGDDQTNSNAERAMEKTLQTMACKAAIKAGDPLTADEMRSLISRMDGVDKISSCPHGRPTSLKLSVRDLEKQFKRI